MRVLSYPLSPAGPRYRDDPAPTFEPVALTERGDPGNWHLVTTYNHCSTHVDAPWHFDPAGLRITDLDPSWWFYESAQLIEVPKGDDELIGQEDLEAHAEAIAVADFLVVRTGFSQLTRSAEPQRWSWHAPGFEPSAASYLSRFERLRALGMDLPSATAPQHPEPGIGFHRIALGAVREGFFLIVEDMRLEPDLAAGPLGPLTMAPTLLEGLDGAPATIWIG